MQEIANKSNIPYISIQKLWRTSYCKTFKYILIRNVFKIELFYAIKNILVIICKLRMKTTMIAYSLSSIIFEMGFKVN